MHKFFDRCARKLTRFLIGTGSQVRTLEQLSIYLQQRAGSLTRAVVSHSDRHAYGFWKRLAIKLTRKSQSRQQREVAICRPVLLELWLYSLNRILPYLRPSDYQLLKRLLSGHVQASLDLAQAQHSQQTKSDIDRLFSLLLEDRADATLAENMYNSVSELIRNPEIRGTLRYHCLKLTSDWQQTVITETLVTNIEASIDAHSKASQPGEESVSSVS